MCAPSPALGRIYVVTYEKTLNEHFKRATNYSNSICMRKMLSFDSHKPVVHTFFPSRPTLEEENCSCPTGPTKWSMLTFY